MLRKIYMYRNRIYTPIAGLAIVCGTKLPKDILRAKAVLRKCVKLPNISEITPFQGAYDDKTDKEENYEQCFGMFLNDSRGSFEGSCN